MYVVVEFLVIVDVIEGDVIGVVEYVYWNYVEFVLLYFVFEFYCCVDVCGEVVCDCY